ncbi:hypothetical protein J4Q44_G00195000 [Coregonus suidteri]|uniref:Uncharacterized protein n=1 Tax=Coregonus suidteri TaxID=861788 RepID=A0AAN8QL71_9TELE
MLKSPLRGPILSNPARSLQPEYSMRHPGVMQEKTSELQWVLLMGEQDIQEEEEEWYGDEGVHRVEQDIQEEEEEWYQYVSKLWELCLVTSAACSSTVVSYAKSLELWRQAAWNTQVE